MRMRNGHHFLCGVPVQNIIDGVVIEEKVGGGDHEK